MKRILCAKRMKACDKLEIVSRTPSSVLMMRAGQAVYNVLKSEFDASRVLFVCGGGNNGGDGLIAAMLSAAEGNIAHVLFVGSEKSCTDETSKRLAEAKKTDVEFVGEMSDNYTAIVDAMFAIGLSRDIDGSNYDIIDRINKSNIPVLSLDIPSGICADNGEVLGCAVYADVTVTIAAYKRGLLLGEGAEYSGKIVCADVGIPCDAADRYDGVDWQVPYVYEKSDLSLLPKRPRLCNKGMFGRVVIIGGAPGMCGAVYLSALAAYRCGAGIVEIVTATENRLPLQVLLPEAIVTAVDWNEPDYEELGCAIGRAYNICIGPGMGMSESALKMLEFVYRNTDRAITVDADALNLTAKHHLEFPAQVSVTITPHPMELSRLTGLDIDEIKADHWEIASDYANEHHVICVAKDAFTAITDGDELFVNVSGSPALAKGGSGDVLSGVITALRGVGLTAFQAAGLGVLVHGLAGEKAAVRYGESAPLARETADLVGEVLKEVYR